MRGIRDIGYRVLVALSANVQDYKQTVRTSQWYWSQGYTRNVLAARIITNAVSMVKHEAGKSVVHALCETYNASTAVLPAS